MSESEREIILHDSFRNMDVRLFDGHASYKNASSKSAYTNEYPGAILDKNMKPNSYLKYLDGKWDCSKCFFCWSLFGNSFLKKLIF